MDCPEQPGKRLDIVKHIPMTGILTIKPVTMMRLICAFMVVLVCVSLYIVSGLKVNTDFLALMDQNSVAVRDFSYVSENFGVTDSFVVVAEPGYSPEALAGYVREVRAEPSVADVNYFANNEDELVIILVKPEFKATELSESHELSLKLTALIDKNGLNAGLTGSYQVLLDSSDAVNRDMVYSSVITIAGISLLLLIYLHLPFMVVLASAVALVSGLIITFALVKLAIGDLNLLTATIPAVLLGLGVDFCLHVIYAFNEYSLKPQIDAQPKNCFNVIFEAYRSTAKPLTVGATTTAGAFLALCLADSDGIHQMGITGAIGITTMFLCISLLLPVLLNYIPAKKLADIRRTENLWLTILCLLSKYRRSIDILLVMILLTAGYFSFQVSFNSDQNKIADNALASVALQDKILKKCNFSPVPVILVSPDEQQEAAKIAFLLGESDGLFGYIQSPALAQETGIDTTDYIGKDNSFLTLAYPAGNPFNPEYFSKIRIITDKLTSEFSGPGNIVTGSAFINDNLSRSIKADMCKTTIGAILIIFAILFLALYRNPDGFITIIPVLLGALFTVGTMGLCGIDYNIMTIVVIPLIFGAGIDDGVHIFCRWKEHEHDVHKAISAIANPLLATTLTSVIAFASLLISDNLGFRQVAIIATSGMIACLFISLVVLPVYLDRRKA